MKYGDSVIYSRDGVESNALVLQSDSIGGTEHLHLLFLDQNFDGALLTSRIPSKVEFHVPPMREGAVVGWKAGIQDADIGVIAALAIASMLPKERDEFVNTMRSKGYEITAIEYVSPVSAPREELAAGPSANVPLPTPDNPGETAPGSGDGPAYQQYPCGCKAGIECPNYFPEHGSPGLSPEDAVSLTELSGSGGLAASVIGTGVGAALPDGVTLSGTFAEPDVTDLSGAPIPVQVAAEFVEQMKNLASVKEPDVTTQLDAAGPAPAEPQPQATTEDAQS